MSRALVLIALVLPTTWATAHDLPVPDGERGVTRLVRELPVPHVAATPRVKKATVDTVEGALALTELWLPGGEVAVLRLDLDSGEIEATLPTLDLTAGARSAVDIVPAWLQAHLSLTLSHLEADRQDELAQLIVDYEGHQALDELAFSIAATSPEELSYDSRYMLAEVLEANALAVYEVDEHVAFADLVEVEGDDGPYTTVEYFYDDGSGEQSWTLEHPYYYWYVLNPKLDMELPLFMDPETFGLSDPPEGVHWRDWMFFSATDEGTWDYRNHWLQEEPNAAHDEDITSLPTMGWLHDFTVDPIVVVADGEGRPLLVEIDWGAGTVLASSALLEDAWSAFDIEAFVENVVQYVQRRDLLEAGETTLVLTDGGEVGSVYVSLLEDASLPVETYDLLADAPDLSGYEKVVVPGGLATEAYEVLYEESSAEALESFVSSGGTLLIQADAGLGDSYDYPCGFSATVDDLDGGSFVGHPVLSESVAEQDSLWDLVQYEGLSGERALSDATSALDAIGWFVTQNMFDNVSEYSANHVDYDGERSVWPQRIMHNHFGNCGECQDMITAAMRASLIPALNVWSMEDHVWNEFYFDGAWHPFQVDWSDGPTRIDYGGVGSDGLFGGGKNVSAIMGYHQNGYIADEHVALYSDTITADVTVTDADGVPVPGAMVLVCVENYYYDSYLDQAAWVHTDQQGVAEITLGDDRNFWFITAADLGGQEVWAPYSIADVQSGSYPNMFLVSEAGDPVIAAEDAVAGSSHEVVLQLGGRLGAPAASLVEGTGDSEVEILFTLDIDSTLLDVRAGHTFLGWYSELGYAYGGGLIHPLEEPGTVDAYVVDADNHALFESGEPFEALATYEPLDSGYLVTTTDQSELWLILSNRGSPRYVHHGTISASMSAATSLDDEEPGGCGCASQGSRTSGAFLGLLAMLGLAVRRRGGRV